MGDGLEVGDGAAECPPCPGVGHRLVERRFGHPDGKGADTRAEQVERPHRHPESGVDVAEDVAGAHRDAVEDEPSDGVGGEHVDRLAGEAGGVAGNDEGGHAPGAGVGAGAGEDRVDVGVGGVGDPRLLPRESPAVAVGFGGQGQGGGVGARPRLRQGEGRHRLAPGDRGHEPAGQRRRAGLDQRVGAETLQGEGGLGLRCTPGPAPPGAGTARWPRPRRRPSRRAAWGRAGRAGRSRPGPGPAGG